MKAGRSRDWSPLLRSLVPVVNHGRTGKMCGSRRR
jgi:hypothetical protein